MFLGGKSRYFDFLDSMWRLCTLVFVQIQKHHRSLIFGLQLTLNLPIIFIKINQFGILNVKKKSEKCPLKCLKVQADDFK